MWRSWGLWIWVGPRPSEADICSLRSGRNASCQDLQRGEIQVSTALLEGGIRKWDAMDRYANPEEGSTAVSALSFELGRRATVSKELISRLVEYGLMPIRRGDGGGVSMDGSIRDLEGSRFLMTEGEHRFGGWTGL